MNRNSSFRSRLLIGSVLLAAGLVAAVHMLSLAVMGRHSFILRLDQRVIALGALLLVVIGLLQVRRGLSPFDQLRERLSSLRNGRASRIEGSYPSEVAPLVHDLNALLDHREEIVRRAMAKAGDLAHGLKTPLAVLTHEADRAEATGHSELAGAIRQEVERMGRQVSYHLAHARAAGSGAAPGARCSVLACVEGLSRTLLRLHADRGLTIDVNVAPDHSVRVEREDLDEILGNLLDNACKWARTRIAVESQILAAGVEKVGITVEDDGPGLSPSLRETVLVRGVRADEAAPGFGLGLAIVRDLAELHGGSIALEAAPGGGLRARLLLPKVD